MYFVPTFIAFIRQTHCLSAGSLDFFCFENII